MALIVSPEEVQTYTGASVSAQDIATATFVIESISGVIIELPDALTTFGATDLAWLKRAVIFQTAWIIDQTDFQSRLNASSLSQDGVSVSASDDLTFVLAPLAKRSLNNCSWARSGTLTVTPADGTPVVGDFTVSDNHSWTPMTGVI